MNFVFQNVKRFCLYCALHYTSLQGLDSFFEVKQIFMTKYHRSITISHVCLVEYGRICRELIVLLMLTLFTWREGGGTPGGLEV
jgi:hypothetical protein